MNLIEKIKEEKGIVNIDTYREYIGEIIDNAMKDKYITDKKSFKTIIESLIMRANIKIDLEKLDDELIREFIETYCETYLFTTIYKDKKYNNIVLDCLYDYMNVNIFLDSEGKYDSDYYQEMIESDETLNYVAEWMGYVESGRVPDSALDDIPVEKYEKSILACIKFFYKDKFQN